MPLVATDRGQDLTDVLVEQVRVASQARTPLRIVGGDSKRFYGRPVDGERLDVSGHRGVVRYDPAELVLTARCGTPLAEVEALLARHGQRLPFEPPAFGATATIGGTIAAGIAGPARVARGPVRDYVLGARLLAGDGRVLRFGGEVMKNVAGFDVARLLAGSLGILGVLLEVSLKVLPLPAGTLTLRQSLAAPAAMDLLASLARRGVPLSGSFWSDGELLVRLEGAAAGFDELAADGWRDTFANDRGDGSLARAAGADAPVVRTGGAATVADRGATDGGCPGAALRPGGGAGMAWPAGVGGRRRARRSSTA